MIVPSSGDGTKLLPFFVTSAFSEKFPEFRTAGTGDPSSDGWIYLRGMFAEEALCYNI